MIRSALIALAFGTLVAPSSAFAQHAKRADVGIFKTFADAIWAGIQSGVQFADGSNRRRLVRFLNDVNVPLTGLRREKYAVWRALPTAGCGTGGLPQSLHGAQQRVRLLTRQLSDKSRILATAVRPAGLRADVTRFAEGLETLLTDKDWMDQLPGYCGMPVARQRGLRQDATASLEAVRLSHAVLDDLIEKLSR